MANEAPQIDPRYVVAPGYHSLSNLSDEDLAYLLQSHEKTASQLEPMSDEDLAAMLSDYAAPGGYTVEEPPKVDVPPPDLSLGEELAGGARELAGGAMFEMSDEAEAAVRAPFSDKTYDELAKDIRLERAKFGQAHPVLAPSLNFAGGVGSMFIPGVGAAGKAVQGVTGISKLASPLARTAASGALAGTAAGFGSGEGLGGSLQNAAIGATIGAPVGAVAHGVGNIAKWAREALTARGAEMSEGEASKHAASILSRRLQESGLTPEQAAQLMDLERSYGIPSVFGTVSPELARLTENVVNTPSGERADLLRRLFEQQAAAPARVAEQVKQAIPTPDYFASHDTIAEGLRRRADTAYQKAYAAGDVSDGRIMDFLRAPDVQIAYKDALANAERLKEAAKLRGEDPSQYDLRQLFVADPQGNIVSQNVPDIRTLDYVKQAMDRRINSLYSSGQGGEASALRAMRDAFVDTLDKAGPAEYKAARQQYKGDIEIRDALEQGAKSNTLRWQQFNKLVKGYSPGEQQAFKTGFVQSIMKRFEDTGNSRNFAKDLLKGNDLLKFKAVMDPGEFDVFEAALKRESELFGTISGTTKGSATFGRAAEKEDINNQIAGGNVDTAIDLMMNPTPGNIARKTLQAMVRLKDANVSRATYTQLARMLKAGTPDEVNSVLQQLEEAAPVQQAADRALERRTAKTGAALASTVAPPPEDTRGQTPPTTDVVIPSIDETPAVAGTPIGAPNGPEAAAAPSRDDTMMGLVNLLGPGIRVWTSGKVELPSGDFVSPDKVAGMLKLPLSIWKKLAVPSAIGEAVSFMGGE